MRALCLLITASLTACSTGLEPRLRTEADSIASAAEAALIEEDPFHKIHDDPYLSASLIEADTITDTPLLDANVAVRSSVPWALRDLTQYLTQRTQLGFEISPDVYGDSEEGAAVASNQNDTTFFISTFNGTARELLDLATSQTGTTWKFSAGMITIMRYDTRVWSIAGIPGTTGVSMETNTQGETGQGGGAGGGGQGAGGVSLSQASTNSTGSQSTQTTIALDLFADLQNTLDSLTSSGGSATVSPATATVIVTDTPAVLTRVGNVLDTMLEQATKPINIRLDVYNVVHTDSESLGVDWTLVYETLNGRYGSTSSAGGPNDPTSNFFSAGVIDETYNYDGTTLALEALAQNGFFVAHQSFAVNTLSGQPEDFTNSIDRTILSAPSQVLVPDAGTVTSQSTSILTDGETLTALPIRLPDGSIRVKLQLSLQQVGAIEQTESGGFIISQPEVASKRINKTVMISPGQTLLLDSFTDTTIDLSKRGIGKPGYWWLGGSKNSSKTHEKTIIAISAY